MMLVRNLSIGDRLPASAGPAPLFHPGPARWHALRVAPFADLGVEAWLRRHGVSEAFHPVLTRTLVERGRKVRRARRYLPGYVFVRFPGAPVVHRILANPDVHGAIARADGTWGVLDPACLQAILSMRFVDKELAARRRAEAARGKAAARLVAGDRALFADGVLSGQECEVVELKADGGARVRMTMFGAEALVQVAAPDLVQLRRIA